VCVRPAHTVYNIHFVHRSNSKKGGILTAVHLSVWDEHGNIFGQNAEDVDNVLTLVLPKLPQKADAVTVFGCIDYWRNSESPQIGPKGGLFRL
jgi:hypothetical protein